MHLPVYRLSMTTIMLRNKPSQNLSVVASIQAALLILTGLIYTSGPQLAVS